VPNLVHAVDRNGLASLTIQVDGKPVDTTPIACSPRCPGAVSDILQLNALILTEGVHTQQIMASGADGQQTVSDTWSFKVDRHAPSVPTGLAAGYDSSRGQAGIYWTESADPPLADGTVGSSDVSYSYRVANADGTWGAWQPAAGAFGTYLSLAPGSRLSYQVEAVDEAANTSAAATFTGVVASAPSPFYGEYGTCNPDLTGFGNVGYVCFQADASAGLRPAVVSGFGASFAYSGNKGAYYNASYVGTGYLERKDGNHVQKQGSVVEVLNISLDGPWARVYGSIKFTAPDFDTGRRMQPNLDVVEFETTPGHIDSYTHRQPFDGRYFKAVWFSPRYKSRSGDDRDRFKFDRIYMARGHEYWFEVRYSYMLTGLFADNPSDPRGRYRHKLGTVPIKCRKTRSKCTYQF
jgi:hypothetical protein